MHRQYLRGGFFTYRLPFKEGTSRTAEDEEAANPDK